MKIIKYKNMTEDQQKVYFGWMKAANSGRYDEKYATAMAKQLGFCSRGDCKATHAPGNPLLFEGSRLVCSNHAFERLREISSSPIAPKKVKPKKAHDESWREVSLL